MICVTDHFVPKYSKAGDIGAGFLIETALGDKSGVRAVAKEAGMYSWFKPVDTRTHPGTFPVEQLIRGRTILRSQLFGNLVIRRLLWTY